VRREKKMRNRVYFMCGLVEENDKRNRRESNVIFFKEQKYPYSK